jgi:hypothetical protein
VSDSVARVGFAHENFAVVENAQSKHITLHIRIHKVVPTQRSAASDHQSTPDWHTHAWTEINPPDGGRRFEFGAQTRANFQVKRSFDASDRQHIVRPLRRRLELANHYTIQHVVSPEFSPA